eukprot:g1331.t1
MASFNLPPTRSFNRLNVRRVSIAPRIMTSPLHFRRLSFQTLAKAEKSEVLGKVINIISTQLNLDKSTIKDDTKFEDLGADSLDVVEIMMAFEEEFEIELKEETAEKIKTVSEAAELIQEEIGK